MSDYVISQMHIEAARNSTDDFNLFHDKNRWHKINNNPFKSPVALGFQLGCFVEDQLNRSPNSNGQCFRDKPSLMNDWQQLHISQYEFTFAGCVKPGDTLQLVIRDGRFSGEGVEQCFSNRLALKANNKTVMLGFKRQASQHFVSDIAPFPAWDDIYQSRDRSFIANGQYFIKHKYMIVGNAKNFLTSAFAEQSDYIDEFVDKVSFPQMYPLSLISSALLERAQAVGQDLIKRPMIYTAHKLSIDQTVLQSMKSNDLLHIIVSSPNETKNEHNNYISHFCIGLLANQRILFHGEIQLAHLSDLFKA